MSEVSGPGMNDQGPPDRALAWFDRAVRWLALGGGAVLIGMVLLTVIDVALRKFANAPIFGAQNASELALLVVVFSAIAYCGREGGHIAIDLVGNTMSPGALRVTDTLVNLVGAAVFIILAWRAVMAADHAMAIGRVSNLLAIPHWPFYGVIALGAALYAMVQIIAGARAASGRSAGRPGGAGGPGGHDEF